MAREIYPGVLVECIDARDAPLLTLNALYRVNRVSTWLGPDRFGRAPGFGVFLDEVPTAAQNGFSGARFKPVSRKRIEPFLRFLSTDQRISA